MGGHHSREEMEEITEHVVNSFKYIFRTIKIYLNI